jgi:carboxymethylenebutenolidase
MSQLRSETVQLETVDGPMTTYVAHPAETPRGGVVVVQEAFGLTGHIHRVTDALASAGFTAVAPAMFHRSEEQVFGYTDYPRLAPVVMSLTQAGITMDIDAALAELTRLGVSDSAQGVIGFCMGGTVALATAARRNLGAAVTFYGGAIAEERFGLPSGLSSGAQLQTPWLGLYGDLDANIPTDEVEQLRNVIAGASVPAEIVRYADADHGFHCDERPSFHAESSSDAWERTITFLSTNLAQTR